MAPPLPPPPKKNLFCPFFPFRKLNCPPFFSRCKYLMLYKLSNQKWSVYFYIYFVFILRSLNNSALTLLILSDHNLFTKTFPLTSPITRSSFYSFSRHHITILLYEKKSFSVNNSVLQFSVLIFLTLLGGPGSDSPQRSMRKFVSHKATHTISRKF